MFKSLLIADDHTVVRETLADYLEASNPCLTIYQAANFEDMWRARDLHGEPEALLVDWRMPGCSGLEGTRRTIEIFPNSSVVIFSGEMTNSDLQAARTLGVDGYIPKSFGARAVVECLHSIERDGAHFPRDFAALECDIRLPSDSRRQSGPERIQGMISPRQTEVLRLAAVGFLNKEIANQLSISEPTVKEHMSNILRTLRAKNRTDAARIARELSLI
ncbi:response regulator transcription factor [Nisaea acidiphila]|uniref:Response regulator transcription factor n=1 Tax=Nisaea acidiphila TaxID=1862145 RepID=A0A9J7ATM2_9PROT|nr:response regulator transcription factor [Nisaea acidiphila]UUX49833.1 response regulator transcription factor [Nisaea acidiphila]